MAQFDVVFTGMGTDLGVHIGTLSAVQKTWLANRVLSKEHTPVALSLQYNLPRQSLNRWVRMLRKGEMLKDSAPNRGGRKHGSKDKAKRTRRSKEQMEEDKKSMGGSLPPKKRRKVVEGEGKKQEVPQLMVVTEEEREGEEEEEEKEEKENSGLPESGAHYI